MGESLSTMSLRDLKQLEGRLEKGINKIKTKKVIIFPKKNKNKLKKRGSLHLFVMYSRQLGFMQGNAFILIWLSLADCVLCSQNELLFAEIEYMQKRVRTRIIASNSIIIYPFHSLDL